MAAPTIEFDAVPDVQFDAIPDAPEFDAVPDAVIAQEAQRATVGAVQALDVMGAPRRLDWSDVNEQLDAERFREAEGFRAQGQPERAQSVRANITPFTTVGQYLASQQQAEAQAAQDVAVTAQRPSTPSDVLGGFLGPALSSTAQPVMESAARNAGAAAGGALGAARFIPHPAANLAVQLLTPMVGSFLGAQAGGAAQETILRSAETPEETSARQQRAAEDEVRNPGSALLGGMLANAPFFRPGLAQFGRAAAGDINAIQNLGIAGTMGAAMEVAAAAARGETAKAKDIAAGIFSNLVMNEPTRLGRRLGLQPSSEQLAAEAPRPTPEPSRTTISEVTTPAPDRVSIAETFPNRETVSIPLTDAPEAAPQFDAIPDAPAAPKMAVVPAIKIGDEVVPGKPGDTHRDILDRWKQGKSEDEQVLAEMDFDTKANPNFFLDETGSQISRAQLKERFGVSDSQGLRDLQQNTPEKVDPSPEVLPEPAPPASPPAASEAPPAAAEPISPQPQPDAAPAPPSSGEPAARVGGEGSDVTGIRNSIVDQARADAGMTERELPARRAFGAVLDEAKAIVAKDTAAPQRLVEELKRDIRPLTDTEDALLTLEQNRREIAREEAIDAVNTAKTEEEKIAAQERLAFADNAAFEIYQVGQNAGTANARGLNARRIMLNRDFTLAKMLNETRAVWNQGEPLSEAQVKEVTELHQRIADLETRLTEKESEIGLAAAKEEYRRTLRATRDEAKIAAKEKRSVVDFFESQAEKARQRIIARRGRLQTTADPLNIAGLVDEAIIGASYIAKGVRDFAQWSKRMLSEFGDRIKPQIKALYDRANEIEAENAQAFVTKEERTPRDVLDKATEISPALVRELTRSHIRAGVEGFENVMGKVEADLKTKFPEITPREINDALSGYGKTKQPSKAEDKKKLAEYRSIARLLSQLEDAQSGQMPKKTGQQRDKPTARVRELQKQVNDAIEAAGLTRRGENDLASRLDAAKSRIRNSIEELQRKIERNDYTERPQREQPVDRERIDLEFELAQTKQQYQKGLIEARRARRSTGQKIWDSTVETFNLSRQLLTSGDMPPIFRQGLFSVGRPVAMTRALVAAFKAMGSEKQRFAIDREIQQRENAPLYQRAKLYLAKDTGQTLTQQEEAYMGNWFKELPRWTVVGPFLRASERSYNTFLNKLRADTFDAMVKAYDVAPTDTATLRRMADIINTMTGRAKLPGRALEQGAGALNAFLFAPRFMASRFKLALGEPLWTGNAKTRKFALEQYARTLAGALVVYGLGKMAGAEVETDPRSTDFLKLKFGNSRLDPLGGLIQVTNFLTRAITGETKTAKEGVRPLRDTMRPLRSIDGVFGTRMAARGRTSGKGASESLFQFLRTKLNPITGAAVDIYTGKTLDRKPVTVSNMLVKMAVPISFQDIMETMEQQGVPRGTAMWILSLFGMGLQTYSPRK